MPLTFPSTYIACPCINVSSHVSAHHLNSSFTTRHDEFNSDDNDAEDNGDEQTFNPQSPRANYSLYPLDHLLYCEDCHEMRCPRCILEEIVCWYCPNCLFEVPITMVRGGENRCQRNCYQCPECTAPLSLVSLEKTDSNRLAAPPETSKGPWVLTCGHCSWTTQEIGVVFDKPNGIAEQLAAKSRSGGREEVNGDSKGDQQIDETEEIDDEESQFAKLRAFYSSQLSKSTPQTAGSTNDIHGGSYRYGSPGALARLVGLYTGTGSQMRGTSKNNNGVMREANGPEEGLKTVGNDEGMIQRMRDAKWEELSSSMQRVDINIQSRFTTDLRPLRPLLRTKRSKRCRTCRHILVKPEPKVSSTRFRIRLLAKNYIPTITLKPLSKKPNPTTPLSLPPNITTQFLLTVRNPLYDTLQVTLATPSETPPSSSSSSQQRYSAKVVILCPQFEVGPNRDVWEEALSNHHHDSSRSRTGTMSSGNTGGSTHGAGRRMGGLVPTTSSSSVTTLGGTGTGTKEEMIGPEAGKIWERGRNSTTVVVEVTPMMTEGVAGGGGGGGSGGGFGGGEGGGGGGGSNEMEYSNKNRSTQQRNGDGFDDEHHDDEDNDDDDDEEENKILEIPIFIRIEYETDSLQQEGGNPNKGSSRFVDDDGGLGEDEEGGEGGGGSGRRANGNRDGDDGDGNGSGNGREKREMAYWIVAGVGTID